jgi:hypothetical protein
MLLIRAGHLCLCFPFNWNTGKGILEIPRKKFHLLAWRINMIIQSILQLILIGILCNAIFWENESTFEITGAIFLLGSTGVAITSQLQIIFKHLGFVTWGNGLHRFNAVLGMALFICRCGRSLVI